MIYLAQANNFTPPDSMNGWLASLAFTLWIGLMCFRWYEQLTGRNQTKTIAPQPFAVEITKQLHEKFADRKDFEEFKGHVTQRHSQIFNRIDSVERGTREMLDKRFADLNEERRESLDKLNEQFLFIRENIAAINRELQLRHDS